MLSNAYFLAKLRCDTAENKPAKNLQKKCKLHPPAHPLCQIGRSADVHLRDWEVREEVPELVGVHLDPGGGEDAPELRGPRLEALVLEQRDAVHPPTLAPISWKLIRWS